MTESSDPSAEVRALMEAGELDAAAIYLRWHLDNQPDDGSARGLFGDCLMQLGQLSAAEREYRHALLDSDDVERLLLRLALVSQSRNRYDEALGYYRRAFALMPPVGGPGGWAETAMSSLSAAWPQHPTTSDRTTILFSGMADRAVAGSAGRNDRGYWEYAPIARAYMSAFDLMGVSHRFIAHPEYVSDAVAEFHSRRCIHFRIGPLNEPRLIKGAYNILISNGSFSEPPHGDNRLHPFVDWTKVAEMFDEVWAPSEYSQAILSARTSAKVVHVPPPVQPPGGGDMPIGRTIARLPVGKGTLERLRFVPLSIFPRLQYRFGERAAREARTLGDIVARISGEPRVFLTVLNRGDDRQQVRALLEAFNNHAARYPDAVLLLLYMASDTSPASVNVDLAQQHLEFPDRLLEAFCSDQIWLSPDRWNLAEIEQLCTIAHFFIGCPSVDGHSHLLLSAMAHGCVPIMPRHTALCNIIDSETAVVIPSRSTSDEEPQGARQAGRHEPDANLITADDVEEALARASALSEADYTKLQVEAEAVVRRKYGLKVVTKRFQRMLATVPESDMGMTGRRA